MPLRILIVEDDHSIRELLEEFLNLEGFSCESVSHGLKARERINEQHFDLMITDFRMPHMNGVELINWCRSQGHELDVIFLTASDALLPHEHEALIQGNARLMKKPLQLRDLVRILRTDFTGQSRIRSPSHFLNQVPNH